MILLDSKGFSAYASVRKFAVYKRSGLVSGGFVPCFPVRNYKRNEKTQKTSQELSWFVYYVYVSTLVANLERPPSC